MRGAELAVVLSDDEASVHRERLCRLLDFFGIPFQVQPDAGEPPPRAANTTVPQSRHVVVAPIPALAAALRRAGGTTEHLPALWRDAAAVYLYATENTAACSAALQVVTGSTSCRFAPLAAGDLSVEISNRFPDLCGPMSGLTARMRPGRRDQVCEIDAATAAVERILDTQMGALFLGVRRHGLQIFVSPSSEIPDVAAPSAGRWFDVRDDFGACVPLVMFLKWAFRDMCWQPHEAGACLIIDDPLLKPRYGFFDFAMLDRLMRERHFATNVAFIPWNYRRTAPAIARMIVASEGRFSISTHGCDHTRAEFGTKSVAVLNAKTALTQQRMEQHFRRTGVRHDDAMVFPQGVFSAASLRALQQHQFLAAVNTEVLSADDPIGPTLADLWSTALLNHSSFPLFTRRYPHLGLENFAFDILLGKPCLIVEHHVFFRDGGVRAGEFIDALNALNVQLRWQPLGKVIRRAYQWRKAPSGDVHIRMFANELELKNEHPRENGDSNSCKRSGPR